MNSVKLKKLEQKVEPVIKPEETIVKWEETSQPQQTQDPPVLPAPGDSNLKKKMKE
jgi:hypothetical protein